MLDQQVWILYIFWNCPWITNNHQIWIIHKKKGCQWQNKSKKIPHFTFFLWRVTRLHQGVLMPIVGFVGLVGNLLSVAVLSGQVELSTFPRKFSLRRRWPTRSTTCWSPSPSSTPPSSPSCCLTTQLSVVRNIETGFLKRFARSEEKFVKGEVRQHFLSTQTFYQNRQPRQKQQRRQV